MKKAALLLTIEQVAELIHGMDFYYRMNKEEDAPKWLIELKARRFQIWQEGLKNDKTNNVK